MIMPSALKAETVSVTMTWSVSDTTDVTGYKIYYAYDAQMSNKLLACATYTNPATTTSLTCSNFNINSFPYYVAVAAVQTDSTEIISSSQEIIGPAVSVVKNFGLTTTPLPQESISKSINFQPATSPIPDGYVADSGLNFADTTGYGWVINHLYGARDRNNPLSPDQAYDTNIHAYPDAKWELALPNGSYTVTICVGDPSYPDSTNSVQAENIAVITNGVLSTTNLWIERSAVIQVADGRLTLTFTGSAAYAKICWIKVTSL
jgi:hypothetical protein